MKVLGLGIGTLPQWGMLVTLLTIAGGMVTAWIRNKPAWVRAQSDADTASGAQYAAQITEFRNEVHKYRNELMLVQARLTMAEGESRRRGDRITMMTLIIHLLIGELKRLDPASETVKQAETLLDRMRQGETDADDGVSDTLGAAQKTTRAAQNTENQIKAEEAR